MTPNLAGLPATLAMLRDNLEVRAAKLAGRATAVNSRTAAALTRAETQMAATEKAAEDIEAFANALEGNNGGPTLDDSSGSSAIISEAAKVAPDKLTVNGVSTS